MDAMQAKVQRLEKETLIASNLLMRCYRTLIFLQSDMPGTGPQPVEADLLKFIEAHEGTRAQHVARKVMKHSDASLAAALRKSLDEKYPNLVNPGQPYDDPPPAVSDSVLKAIGAAYQRETNGSKG